MTKEVQDKYSIPLEFISFGMLNAKAYWVASYMKNYMKKETHTERRFVIPSNTIEVVYGGIFLLKDAEFHEKKLNAYYHNSRSFGGNTLRTDLYDYAECAVKPIKFMSLNDLKTYKYDVGEEIMCGVYVGNMSNKRVRYNVEHRPYYKSPKVDKESFITMINERRKKL